MGAYSCDITVNRKREYGFASSRLERGDRPSEEVVKAVDHVNDREPKYPWQLHSWAVVDGYVEVVLVREVPA